MEKEQFGFEVLAFDGEKLFEQMEPEELHITSFHTFNVTQLKRNGFAIEYIEEVIKENHIYYKQDMYDYYKSVNKELPEWLKVFEKTKRRL
jgi:hypothetical protein